MMLYQKNTLCAKKLLIFYGTAHRNRCYELLDRNMRSGTEIVNPCINLILLLVDLCFRVVSVLVKNRLRRHVTYAPEIFHKSSIIFHKSSIILKFLKNISLQTLLSLKYGFLWFSTKISKIMKLQILFFQNSSFVCPSKLLSIFLFISQKLLKIWSLTAVSKARVHGNFLNFASF